MTKNIFVKEFKNFLANQQIGSDATCLIVGLGNWNVTPDALGPIVCENIVVTRHLFEFQPETVRKDTGR